MSSPLRPGGSASGRTFGTCEQAVLTLSIVATGVDGRKCTTAHCLPSAASNPAQPAAVVISSAAQATAAAAARGSGIRRRTDPGTPASLRPGSVPQGAGAGAGADQSGAGAAADQGRPPSKPG